MLELVVFDIDGVLTDGGILVDAQGQEMKRLNIKDVDAVYEIKRRGYRIAAITGEDTKIVDYFRSRFPWDHFLAGKKKKRDALIALCAEMGISLANTAYVGDGKFDLDVFPVVGLSVCPADAIQEARALCNVVLQLKGGNGCVWELLSVLDRYEKRSLADRQQISVSNTSTPKEQNKVKLSDYIFQFLKARGVNECFVLPGGGAMHLVDSLGKSGMDYVAFQHEQGAACAAEAYGQHTGTPGFLLVTSGPGATNAITPVAAGYLDSTPMFVVSGQAKRPDLVGNRGVRQTGSQELPVIPMVEPVTKYAAEIMEPMAIRQHLEHAWLEATSGRPGPVWLSIPLDVQGAMIDVTALSPYEPARPSEPDYLDFAERCLGLLKASKKPLLLAGNGIHLARGEHALDELLKLAPIPVQTTWKSIGLFGDEHPLYCGHPGIMGDRGANLMLQEADLLLVIGSRLDTSLTAFNEPHFGKNAQKVVVDIDANEISRMNMDIALSLAGDARKFMEAFSVVLAKENLPVNTWSAWLEYGQSLRAKYPVITSAHREKQDKVSPYYFIDRLCSLLTSEDLIVPESSGGAGEITYQAFRLKQGQKMKNAAGLGSMGFGLPYSIGSCLANNRRRTILINGDGAFQLNIQELETLHRLQLPVKIFVWCNGGYASIRAMQTGNFGRMVASGVESGFSVPDVCAVANAYGLCTFRMRNNREMEQLLPEVLAAPGPVLCAVETDPLETVSPRVKAIPQPDGSMKSGALENMWPPMEE